MVQVVPKNTVSMKILMLLEPVCSFENKINIILMMVNTTNVILSGRCDRMCCKCFSLLR